MTTTSTTPSRTRFPPTPVAAPTDVAVSCTRGRRRDRLAVVGELDLGSTPVLVEALQALDVSRPVAVSLRGVRFADSHGLAPLFDAASDRRVCGGPPLRLADVSPAVERVLLCLGVRWAPQLDLDAWRAPRTAQPPPRTPVDRPPAHPAGRAASPTHARRHAQEEPPT